MKQIIYIIVTLLLIAGCNSQRKQIPTEQLSETPIDTVMIQEIDSIKYTVDFLNSLEWTEEEIAHLDSLENNLVCKNAERDLDTIINHIKVIFTTRRD